MILHPFVSLHQTPPHVNHSIDQSRFFLAKLLLLTPISEILLAAAAGACYKPCGNMKMHLSALVFTVALIVAPLGAQVPPCAAPLPPAEEQETDEPTTEEELEAADETSAADEDEATDAEENIEQADARISPAATQTLDATRLQMDELAALLALVVDAQTAATHAPQIVAAFEALRNVDFSILAEEDEELVAAEFAEDMFIRLDDELARLADEDYFGDSVLEELLGTTTAAEEPERPAPAAPAPAEDAADSPVQEAGTESAATDCPTPIHLEDHD